MQSIRFHGEPPYAVAVVHGGPGARGSLRPVARELGRTAGVLEPMQTAPTVDGQAEELHVRGAIEDRGRHRVPYCGDTRRVGPPTPGGA